MIKMQEILALSVEERLLMIEKIWDSIDSANEVENTTAIEEELDRRLNRYNKGETQFFSWSEVKQRA